jgi:Tfp pilus assembly protein PilX
MRRQAIDQPTTPDRHLKNRDEGSSLIIALVVIIIGAFFVLPTMTYIMTVNQASRLRIEGANSSEIVRGGLRSVLYNPAALYSACANSGVSDASAINLAVPPGLNISTKCTTTKNAQQWVPSDLRWALATTMAGSAAVIPPPQSDGTISAQWCTSAVTDSLPCGNAYPGSGSTTPTAWVGDATDTSIGSKVFLPYVPSVIDTPGYAGGYNVDIGGGSFCKVYFPGRYTDDVVITGTTPVYFVSGVYYFEKALRFSGDAKVVVGAGATDGCVDSDAVAVADAGYSDATSSGVGGTFVFGAQGRMIIDTATPSSTGTGVNIVFNRRLVDPSDSDVIMNNVAIMSVNGVNGGTVTNDEDIPSLLHVPASKVWATPLVEPINQGFDASTLIPTAVPTGATPCAPPPAAPAATCPIVDVNLTTAMPVSVSIPGYISVPQGSVSINTAPGMTAGKKISFGGGVLTGTIGVSIDKPVSLQIGLLNSVVQKTFKIVSQTTNSSPRVTATALIQINQTGGYAINSWVTSFG